MLAFHVALVDIGVKSVAEGLDATEPINFSLSGSFNRGKAVEKARQKKISMEVDTNFMFGKFLGDRILKGRREYSVQCEDGLSATSLDERYVCGKMNLGATLKDKLATRI